MQNLPPPLPFPHALSFSHCRAKDKLAARSDGAPASAPPAAPPVALSVKEEEAVDVAPSGGAARGRKNPYDHYELEVEGRRNSKQSAVQGEDDAMWDMLYRVMMPSPELCLQQMQQLWMAMQEEAAKNDAVGKAGNGKAKGRRGGREVVDLRTLLIHCTQAVATDDRRRSATELLKQHASPQGDDTQRLAHCFAEGLQARLAGTGSMVYQSLHGFLGHAGYA